LSKPLEETMTLLTWLDRNGYISLVTEKNKPIEQMPTLILNNFAETMGFHQ